MLLWSTKTSARTTNNRVVQAEWRGDSIVGKADVEVCEDGRKTGKVSVNVDGAGSLLYEMIVEVSKSVV